MGWMRSVEIGALVGAMSAGAVRAQAPRAQAPMELQRLQGVVELDGTSDEAAWESVEPLPLTMYFPTFGGTPQERSGFPFRASAFKPPATKP